MHSRKLPESAKHEMKQFYSSQPEYKEFISTPEFYYNVSGKQPPKPVPVFFKQKKLKHYQQIEEVERERAKTI